MHKSEAQKSSRKTPWNESELLTPTQVFLKENYDMRYINHHRKVSDSGEADMINSYLPEKCTYCGSATFKKNGCTESGIQ